MDRNCQRLRGAIPEGEAPGRRTTGLAACCIPSHRAVEYELNPPSSPFLSEQKGEKKKTANNTVCDMCYELFTNVLFSEHEKKKASHQAC